MDERNSADPILIRQQLMSSGCALYVHLDEACEMDPIGVKMLEDNHLACWAVPDMQHDERGYTLYYEGQGKEHFTSQAVWTQEALLRFLKNVLKACEEMQNYLIDESAALWSVDALRFKDNGDAVFCLTPFVHVSPQSLASFLVEAICLRNIDTSEKTDYVALLLNGAKAQPFTLMALRQLIREIEKTMEESVVRAPQNRKVPLVDDSVAFLRAPEDTEASRARRIKAVVPENTPQDLPVSEDEEDPIALLREKALRSSEIEPKPLRNESSAHEKPRPSPGNREEQAMSFPVETPPSPNDKPMTLLDLLTHWSKENYERYRAGREKSDAPPKLIWEEHGSVGKMASRKTRRMNEKNEVAIHGPRLRFQNGKEVPLTKALLVIGRDAHCDVVIDDRSVSMQHARVHEAMGSIYLTDLRSTAGTTINQKALLPLKAYLLEQGDRIRLGSCEAVFLY